MDFLSTYHLQGLVLGLCSFLIIGIFHPIVIKGEYSYRFFQKPDNNGLASDSPLYKQPYNNEPSVSLSVTYCGWFM